MTIRILNAWNGNAEGSIISLSNSEETRLISLGIAEIPKSVKSSVDSAIPSRATTADLTGTGVEQVGSQLFVNGVAVGVKNYATSTAAIADGATARLNMFQIGLLGYICDGTNTVVISTSPVFF